METMPTMDALNNVPEFPAPAAAPTNKRTRQVLMTALKFAISAVLIYIILRGTSVSEVLTAMASANLFLLFLAAASHIIGFTLSAYRWRLLLRSQGADSSIMYLIQSYVISVFFNNFLPSTIGGDGVRAYDSWRLGQSKSGAVAVVFVDRFLGLLVLMLFAMVAALFSPEIMSSDPSLYAWVIVGTLGCLTLTAIIFVPSEYLPRLVTRLPIPFKEKLLKILRSFLAFQGKTSVLIRALWLSTMLQANVVIHYFLISEALGLNIPFMSFFLIVPLATFIMMLPISINAIGVREGTFAFFFAAFGVLRPEAIAFSWIVYGMIVVQGLIGGVLYALRR